MSIHVNFYHRDGRSGPSWNLDVAPVPGQQVRRSGGECWEVQVVQWDGNNLIRCICTTAEEEGSPS